MKEKVLLDTDIGSDIDDAICLSYLLSNPACELIGITTVTGNTVERAIMAEYICEKAGKKVPVFPGCREPVIGEQKQKDVPQFEYLRKINYFKDFKEGYAIEFLRKTIRENPGEINLITIGPLTNIALLFKMDPEIPLLLKGFYMMCGVFFEEKFEWNIICDPYAAYIVFSSNLNNVYVCGLDVTTKVKMEKEEILRNFKGKKLLDEILNFAEIWFRGRDIITFHDPLAATILFKKDICRFKRGKIKVEIENKEKTGRTEFIEDENGKIMVAYEVKPEEFFAHFFSFF